MRSRSWPILSAPLGGLLVALLTASATAPLAGQTTGAGPQTSEFRYQVKFVCGPYAVRNGVLAGGQYFTAINVRNLSGDSIVIRKRFARTEPWERAGRISARFRASLRAGEALNIACPDIRQHSQVPATAFIEGFAQIDSPRELEVTAVYTGSPRQPAAGALPALSTIDVERCTGVRVPVCLPVRDSLHTGIAQWRVVREPSGPVTPYPVLLATPHPLWNTTLAAPARWVRGNNQAAGITEYEVRFCLCQDFEDVRLDLRLLADDDMAGVWLNGNPVVPPKSGGWGFQAQNLVTASITSGFVSGANTLRVRVSNGGAPTGLLAHVLLSAARGACP